MSADGEEAQSIVRWTLAEPVARALARDVEASVEERGLAVALFEADEARKLWTLSVYCPSSEVTEIAGALSALAGRHGVDNRPSVATVEDADWVTKTLEGLRPVSVGRYFVHGTHDAQRVRPWHHAIRIDAAQAFGTGHHATTAGCLAALGNHLKRRRPGKILDLGTGTGVLAIAAALSCQADVIATDIDPLATAIAKRNCCINAVGRRVRCLTATGLRHRDVTAGGRYDLVIANILAGPLQAMARDLARAIATGGTAILSGLLPRQRATIVATYRMHGLRLVSANIRDGWLVLELEKPPRQSGHDA